MYPAILLNLLPLAHAIPTLATSNLTSSTLNYSISYADNLCDFLQTPVSIVPGQCANLYSRSYEFGNFVRGTDYPCANCSINTYNNSDCAGPSAGVINANGYNSGCVAFNTEGASIQLVC